ncbi:MAG: hypothetical protein R8M45_10285, partial [Ghiorsea sp.]
AVIAVANGQKAVFAPDVVNMNAFRVTDGLIVMIECEGCGNETTAHIDGYCLQCAPKYAKEAIENIEIEEQLYTTLQAAQDWANGVTGQGDG